jgi:endonuclease YncB( thermonuclease family)
MKQKYSFLLAFLITCLIASNAFIFSVINKSEKESVLIARVIDGDTVELQGGEKIRLVNINTPEKNQNGYNEATNFVKQFENQTVQIERLGSDKYSRTLARNFAPDYLNLEIVKQGLATKFLVSEGEEKTFAEAEESAIKSEKGIWKKSSYANCFEAEINPTKELVSIKNNCPPINVKDWKVKDESRKEYNFDSISLGEVNLHSFSGKDNETDIFWNTQDVWNNDKDSFYLLDSQGALVYHNFYGY